MAQTINNPEIPHISAINDGLVPGKMLRIQGTSNGDRFNINLQCGPNVSPRDDIALHLSVRPSEGYIARNTLIAQNWGEEEGQGYNPIVPGTPFEILILTDFKDFKIAINAKHFCEFIHRVPINKITHLTIDGDIKVKLIGYELSAPAPNVAPPQGPPQGMYGPPGGPMPPPGGYGPLPQGGYGPPGMYGPPPPPGHQQEEQGSGIEGFLGQAGAAIAGAFGNAVLQGALSAKQGGTNQSTPQQPAAQPAPQAAPQQPFAGGYGGQSVGGLGSIGSFLTNTLAESISHRSTPQQPAVQQPPQAPPQGQSDGGLGSIGSFLTNTLAETILKPKQQKKKHKKELKALKKAQKALPVAGIGFIGYGSKKKLKSEKKYKYKKSSSSSSSSSSSDSS